MRTLNLDDATAEEFLVRLADRVPPDVTIGRPLAVNAHIDGSVEFVTSEGFYFLEPGGTASRLLYLGRRAELTRWRDRREIMRAIDSLP